MESTRQGRPIKVIEVNVIWLSKLVTTMIHHVVIDLFLFHLKSRNSTGKGFKKC